MRQKIVAGNWKMSTTFSDAMVLAGQIKESVEDLHELEIVICPPFVWIYPIFELFEKGPSNLKLGAQNMYFVDEGQYTGEISPLMLKNLCQYVILGHSERRSHFHESNDLINDKIQAALRADLKPIVCVGEWRKIPGSYAADDVRRQLKASLENVPPNQLSQIVIVYEPVWAAGTHNAASGAYAAEIIKVLRRELEGLYGQEASQQIRILYGGSVTSENILEFIRQEGIDGALVGGASLKAREFIKICELTAEYSKS